MAEKLVNVIKKSLQALPRFYVLNKSILRKNVLLFGFLLIFFIFFDKRVLDVDLLNGYDVDEFYFLRILYSRQFYGFNHLDPAKFFSGFYSYGRVFWICAFILTYVPFFLGKLSGALFAARLMSSLFAIQGLLIFKEILIKTGYEKFAVITVCAVSLLMVHFWAVGSWVHPDSMMMFFVMLSFYYYFSIERDEVLAPTNFLIAISIAIAIKVQTLQLVPLLVLYNFKEFILHPSVTAFTSSVKKNINSLIIITVIFILLNPYLIHPAGARLFYESFTKDMISNKTNYWSGHIPSFFEKQVSFTSAYLSEWIIVMTLITCVIFTVKKIKLLKENFEKFSFIISLAVMITYYSLFVNKTWPHYYLPIAFMVLIVFYFTIGAIVLEVKIRCIILSSVLFLQVINLYKHTDFLKNWIFPQRLLKANNSYALKDSITNFLNKQPDRKTSHIVFTYLLPIPVASAGLDFNNVFHIPVVDDEQLHQISKLAPFPPDYVIVQKNMYYDKFNKSSAPANDAPVALIDSIKQGKISSFKIVDSTNELLYIKRVK